MTDALETLTEAVLTNAAPHSIEVICTDINESFEFEYDDGKKVHGSKAFAAKFQKLINASPPAVQARLMELYMKLELKRLAMQDGEDVGELCDEDLLLQAKLLAKEISGEAP